MSGNGKAWLPAKTMPKEIEFQMKARKDRGTKWKHKKVLITCADCGTSEYRDKKAIYCLECSHRRNNECVQRRRLSEKSR